jgi:hypothetical protein
VRRLTRDEGHRLALRLCDGDAARASRVLASAMQTDQRTVSAAEVYQAMRQPPQPVSQSMPPPVRATA